MTKEQWISSQIRREIEKYPYSDPSSAQGRAVRAYEYFSSSIAEEDDVERKAFLRAFVIENSVALQDHDVLAIAVKHWDAIEEGA